MGDGSTSRSPLARREEEEKKKKKKSRNQLARTNSTQSLWSSISPQWFSELRRLDERSLRGNNYHGQDMVGGLSHHLVLGHWSLSPFRHYGVYITSITTSRLGITGQYNLKCGCLYGVVPKGLLLPELWCIASRDKPPDKIFLPAKNTVSST